MPHSAEGQDIGRGTWPWPVDIGAGGLPRLQERDMGLKCPMPGSPMETSPLSFTWSEYMLSISWDRSWHLPSLPRPAACAFPPRYAPG